jgi:hypothetical protein
VLNILIGKGEGKTSFTRQMNRCEAGYKMVPKDMFELDSTG